MKSEKAVVTCALTGVLTNPQQHPVPVTPEEMAKSAKEAFDAGASVMHVHYRRQEPGLGHLPSWEPAVAAEIDEAISAWTARRSASDVVAALDRASVPAATAALPAPTILR